MKEDYYYWEIVALEVRFDFDLLLLVVAVVRFDR